MKINLQRLILILLYKSLLKNQQTKIIFLINFKLRKIELHLVDYGCSIVDNSTLFEFELISLNIFIKVFSIKKMLIFCFTP